MSLRHSLYAAPEFHCHPFRPKPRIVPGASSTQQFPADTVVRFGIPMTTVKKQTAFNRALTPSAELAAVIGDAPQPRTEVTKLLWAYIKEKGLQNPANKRNILCDEKLKAVMGKDEVTMFEMSGLVGKHLA
jgi:chromatin remodeling complex protein RSC6